MIHQPKHIYRNSGSVPAQGYTASNAGELVSRKLERFSLGAAAVKEENCYYAVISQKTSAPPLPPLPEELYANEARADGFFLHTQQEAVFVLSRQPRGVLYGVELWENLSKDMDKFSGDVIDYPHSEFRAFHLDMRYGCPSFERILAIIDTLSSLRYNALLLEYENRFPFKEHADIVAPEHYTQEETAKIIEYCAQHHMELIPLQQTIGHMEYILKLPQYNHLREYKLEFDAAKTPDLEKLSFSMYKDIGEICVSNEEAYALVDSLVDQIINAHQYSRYVHLGCDEVGHVLICDECRQRYGEDGTARLYSEHINRMAAKVLSAGKIPIIWDDMTRRLSQDELDGLDKRVAIMLWHYYDDETYIRNSVMRLKKAGFTVLGASAAKCSESGKTDYHDTPDYAMRLTNIDIWNNICADEGMRGHCLTVWSNSVGTLAPPHPFFDTIWFPVYYAAVSMWDRCTVREGFDAKFVSEYFGVEGMDYFLKGSPIGRCKLLENIKHKAIRHKYEAEAMWVMEMVNALRRETISISRVLFRLTKDITEAERKNINNRILGIKAAREAIRPLVYEVVATHYSAEEADLFVGSRFDSDGMLLARILDLE